MVVVAIVVVDVGMRIVGCGDGGIIGCACRVIEPIHIAVCSINDRG